MSEPVAAEPAGWKVPGVVALVIAALAIPVALVSFSAFGWTERWDSWTFLLAVLGFVFLSPLCALVGAVTGLACWVEARHHGRRDWPAVAAMLLGVGSGIAWALILFA